MLIPFWQIPWPSAGIGVRTAQDPAAMTKSIAAAVHSVDPEIALATPAHDGAGARRGAGGRPVHADSV